MLSRLLFILVMLVTTFTSPFLSHAQQEVTLSLLVPEFWRNTLITPELISQFEAENPGIKVHVKYTNVDAPADGDIEAYLELLLELASSADVGYVNLEALTPEGTRAGYFLDLSPLTSSDASLNVDDFIPAVWQSFQWDTGVWALPVSTDITVATYDAAAFDAAGLAYPNENWTIEDFANAARTLTVYDSSGEITTPGLMVGGFGTDALPLLFRALSGKGFYDMNSVPANPAFADPALESLLTRWLELEAEGVVTTEFSENFMDIPLRIEGSFGLSSGIFAVSTNGETDQEEPPQRQGALLPGGIAGLDVRGFAVSAGTLYPEQAYALAKFLTFQPSIANNFEGASPARTSLRGIEAAAPGGGEGGVVIGRPPLNPEAQAFIDQAVMNGLPVSEMRYSVYIGAALADMRENEVDARTALQNAEALAVANGQAADAQRSAVTISVAPPPPPVVMGANEISLNFAVASNFIGGGLPNQEQWEQLARDFADSDPQVGQVVIEPAAAQDMSALTTTYDCFSLSNNGVPGADLSTLLPLDPFLDTDVNFDRGDVLGNTLAQLQRENQTWAIPLVIQPQILRYNPEILANAGVNPPTNGWTASEFIDALRALQAYNPDQEPFIPNDPGGTSLFMLIAAFGGLPVDYRTSPPTINYTDPAAVEAIRQVLDLVKVGLIHYEQLAGGGFTIRIGGEQNETIPVYTDSFLPFGPGNGDTNTDGMTSYPRGSQYNTLSYEITTAYISSSTENPEACYRWLSLLSQNPQLFTGMPARRSALSNPAVAAAQGAGIVDLYAQIETLMADPNTIIFPSLFRAGGSPADFMREFWLRQAFDRYVLEDADLDAELTAAQEYVTAFDQCTAAIPANTATTQEEFMAYFQQFNDCAVQVDPTFGGGF